MYQVTKRDGSVAEFNINKISAAIAKAFEAMGKQSHPSVMDMLALRTTADFESKIQDGLVAVEDIQDSVEKVLSEAGYADVAKAYILYRKQREKVRNIGSTMLNYKDLVDNYLKINDWRVKENSTVTYSVGGLILSNSGAITANYWLSEVYDKEIADAHRNALIHIHDLSMLTGYCAGWSLKQLIKEGLGGVVGKITSSPASHLSTLCNQMVNFLGIMQNEWAGAQAFSSFDTYLAPFVRVDNLSQKEVKQCVQSHPHLLHHQGFRLERHGEQPASVRDDRQVRHPLFLQLHQLRYGALGCALHVLPSAAGPAGAAEKIRRLLRQRRVHRLRGRGDHQPAPHRL